MALCNTGSLWRQCQWVAALFDYALSYAAERKQFGQPIGKFQGVSFQIADMITEIDAADMLTLASAWRWIKVCQRTVKASAKVYNRNAGAGN